MTAPVEFGVNYAATVTRVRSRLIAFLIALWRELTSYDDEAADEFAEAAVPAVAAAQSLIAAITEQYLLLILEIFGVDVDEIEPVDLDRVTGAAARRGVDPDEVYFRPFGEARWRISRGEDLDAVKQRGQRRLEVIAATDAQLAKFHTAHEVFADPAVERAGVKYWRRVPRGPSTCGLCLVASTQRYRVIDEPQIHPGCDCGVEPMPPGEHPRVIDRELLERVHAEIAERFGSEAVDFSAGELYRRALIVHDHGELGPVLARRGDHFTDLDEAREREEALT